MLMIMVEHGLYMGQTRVIHGLNMTLYHAVDGFMGVIHGSSTSQTRVVQESITGYLSYSICAKLYLYISVHVVNFNSFSTISMTSERAKRLLSIEFIDTIPEDVNLIEYLKSLTVDAKAAIMSSAKGYFYALAVSKQPNIPRTELELALAQSVRDLSNQIANITDYYRIVHQIELPSPRLLNDSPSEQTKMLSSIPLQQSSQNSTVVVESIFSQGTDKGKDDDEDEDDIDWDAPVKGDAGFDMGLG